MGRVMEGRLSPYLFSFLSVEVRTGNKTSHLIDLTHISYILGAKRDIKFRKLRDIQHSFNFTFDMERSYQNCTMKCFFTLITCSFGKSAIFDCIFITSVFLVAASKVSPTPSQDSLSSQSSEACMPPEVRQDWLHVHMQFLLFSSLRLSGKISVASKTKYSLLFCD